MSLTEDELAGGQEKHPRSPKGFSCSSQLQGQSWGVRPYSHPFLRKQMCQSTEHLLCKATGKVSQLDFHC